MEYLKVLFNLSTLPQQEQAILIARFTIVTITIQFISVMATLFIQIYLKHADVKIESKKIKAKRCITKYQDIYTNIESVYRDLPGDSDYYDRNMIIIKNTRRIVTDNGLYFTNNAKKIVSNLLDILTVKVATPGVDNIDTYRAEINKLKKEFDKA